MWKKTLAMAVVTPAMLLTMAAPPVAAAPGDPVSANLALASAGATITSSGEETAGSNGTDLANDGDMSTRWSSNHADDAQLTVKLAKPTIIEKVVIKWEDACAAKYKLQVSTDGVAFVDATDVISRANCDPATPDTQTIKAELASTKYQYVRMQGVERTLISGAKWGISLYEMEVWGIPTPAGKNVALASAGATVTASGQEVPDRWGPAKAIDGDADKTAASAAQSRWSSNTADNAQITVKLAQPTVVDHVAIVWQGACAAKYKLQVSNDGVTFVDATDVISPTCDTRDVQKFTTAVAGTAYQYVRMQGVERTPINGVKYGISLWEFEVWDGEEAVTSAPSEGINLIPLPVNMETPDEAPFKLGAGSRIVANTADAKKTGNYLAEIFRTSTGLPLPVVDGSTGDADDILLLQTPGAIAGVEGQFVEEAYALSVDAVTGVKVTAPNSDGVFNGVQTLRQLFPAFIESKQKVIAEWNAPAVEITDAPRFDKRGMMLDVAREFKTPAEVKNIIDSLAAYKISTLHFHLADDQGWRIEITNDGKVAGDDIDYNLLTEVSGKTGMTQFNRTYKDHLGHTGFYTQDEYKDLVAYAASRHIEIIPEIDVPGHTSAILHAIPQLNTPNSRPLAQDSGVIAEDGTGNVGQSSLDVDEPKTWVFLEHVFGQIADMTPGEYIHMGGDETHVTPPADFKRFITKTVSLIHDLGKKPIGWNEVAVAGLTPGDGIQYWTGDTADTLDAIKNKGAKLMVSNGSTSYIDMKYNDKTPIGLTWAGTGDFPTYYDWDPAATVKDKDVNLPDSAILGVEAAQWSETIRGGAQAEFMAFPRVVSFAEIGWTPQAQRNVNDFKVRMSSMGQRFLTLGTNFYDGNEAKWRHSMAGLPVAVSPGKDLKLDVGQLAAPGTKVSEDGLTIAVDSIDDADGVSASNIVGDLGVTINWGDGSATSDATLVPEVARNHLAAGSLYTVQATHSYATAGTYTGVMTASNGRNANFTVTVAAGTPDPELPYVWDSSETPTLTTVDTPVKADYRALMTLTGFVPGEYVTLTLGGKPIGTVLPDATGKVTQQIPVSANTYGGTYDLTAVQGDRTATDQLTVISTLVPLENKIPQGDLSINSVSSQELTGETAPNGPASALIDGNIDSFWHTQWQNGTSNFPHSVVFDLGESYDVTGFEYTQRQSNTNGKLKDYELYVSDSATEFGTKVASGSFLDVTRPQVIEITGNKVGRYVKLVGLNSIAGNAFGGGAEVNIGGVLPTGTTPEPSISVAPGTVEAGKDLTLTLGGFPANTEVSLSLAPGILLGKVTTDTEGAATITAAVPATVPAGSYQIIATAGDISESAEITVTAAPTTEPTDPATTDPTDPTTTEPTDPATTDPTDPTTTEPTDPATTDSSKAPEPSDSASANAPAGNGNDLASTGSGTAPFLMGGLLLILTGGVSLLVRQKRKSSHA